ncbi:toll/interleukin-1 receptor domain-containing protein [Thioalkalivibrio sp. XN279]|uniref:toll/interleukin-1 receptor domain-containing protein n=1 Tax=Thioalkalivibrio sp. XN279 TaxID=2714953 RepID=UPI00140B50F3|nr:toll/interleukin-1 receptor domain-containing protein [Thioalkalivibrio sp. XN279]NHA13984.1 toll/interleukin-1 receptor domain-containing protein [Thioalkalivibrio sp. XN279]
MALKPPPQNAPAFCAFISYSHTDERHAAWLQKALERWKVPRRLVGAEGRFGPIPERLGKVFLDRDELPSASSLSDEIQAALAASETLVVICSPAAARSRWVNEEIRSFKALGKAQRVLAMIVAGEPWASDRPEQADEECFPEALRYAVDAAGALTPERTELIAADLRPGKDGKQAALLKIVAGILGVGFDTLRQREAQRRQRRLVAVAAAAIAGMGVTSLLAASAWFARLEADAQRAQAEANFDLARDAVDRYLTRVADNPELKTSGLTTLRRQLLETAREFYQDFASRQAGEEITAELAHAHHRLANISRVMGDLDVAEAEVRLAIEQTEQLLARAPQDALHAFNLANMTSELGLVLANQGKPEADATYAAALAQMEALDLGNSDDLFHRSALASLLDNYGQWIEKQGRPAEAERRMREGLRLRQALVLADPDNLAYQGLVIYSTINLSALYGRTGQLEAGRDTARLGVEQGEALLPRQPDNPETRISLSAAYENLGGIEMLLEDYEASAAAYDRSRELKVALVMDHPAVLDYRLKLAGTYTNLGELASRQAKHEDALPWYDQSTELLRWIIGRSPDMALARYYLSYTCGWQGRALDALQRHAQAVDAWQCAVDNDPTGDASLVEALEAARRRL